MNHIKPFHHLILLHVLISFNEYVFCVVLLEFVPQVPNENPPPSEHPVQVAYLLTLNGRGVRQVRRLFKLLYHQDHFFYIHVDAVSVLYINLIISPFALEC